MKASIANAVVLKRWLLANAGNVVDSCMGKFQTRSRVDLQEQQLNLLKKQLDYCANHIAYYREGFAQLDFAPSSIRDLTQLEKLPLLDKVTVRDKAADFLNPNHSQTKLHKSFSSGSTGEPFASYFDTRAWYRKKYLVKLRARFACGMRIGQQVAILECENEEQIAARNKSVWLADVFLKVRVFSLFQNTEQLLSELREFEPQNIYAYPSHLLELASAGAKPAIPGVERLFTSSEFLERGMRQFIEDQFEAPIYDHYGSTEFKEVAWQCKEKNWYHINNDELICEVVNSRGENVINEPGEIIVSDLRNKAMPLLRFRVGDLGLMSNDPCNCGYHGNSIKPLGGRSSDYLEMEGGIALSPFRFTTEIEYLPGLLQYQVVQRSLQEIDVRTRWQSEPASDSMQKVESIIREALVQGSSEELAKKVQINVEACNSIANEENGKFKVIKRAF